MSDLDIQSKVSPSILARKFRKKLRQIENLERLNRPLTEEEYIKVNSKSSVRDRLKDVLERIENEPEHPPTAFTAPHPHASDQSIQNDSRTSTDSWDLQSNDADTDEITLTSKEVIVSSKSPLPLVTSASAGAGDQINSGATSETHDRALQKQAVNAQPKAQPVKEKKDNKPGKGSAHLSKRLCQVTYLDGHSDIITSLVIVGEMVVTASRDTTLKSWNLTTGQELHTFGGHTETVTCVLAVGAEYGCLIDSGFPPEDTLIISSSFDCSLKMWSLNSGRLLKSVYTFNPLTKICFFPSAKQIVTGSDGGKLELWNIATGENCFSTLAYDASVTGIVMSGEIIYSSSAAGVIKVHQVREDGSLACLFVSEEIRTMDGRTLRPRHVRCMADSPGKGLLFGDDSRNLKLLDWRNGQVKKFPNHTSDFSSTDAVCCHDNHVLTSSYDLDEGLGYINVWQYQSGGLTYQATIDDRETERIMCLDFCLKPKGDLLIVSGGVDLKMWELLSSKSSSESVTNEETISLEFRQALSIAATESASESEEDSGADDDEEEEEAGGGGREGANDGSSQQWSILSWCSIL